MVGRRSRVITAGIREQACLVRQQTVTATVFVESSAQSINGRL